MIKILTDSAADISFAEAKILGIEILPLKIVFSDRVYSQDIDITIAEFYEKLSTAERLPSTSQANPGDYLPFFTAAKEAGDSVLVIALSGELSGTMQSAVLAKEMAGYEDIHIVDSRQAVVGQRLLVEYGVKLRKEGKSAGEIAAILMEARNRVALWGMVDTLKYLHKGGRLSKSAAMVGTMLHVKPIIAVQDGVIVLLDKARGVKGGMKSMLRMIEGKKDFDPTVPVYFGYSGTDDQLGRTFQAMAEEEFAFTDTSLHQIGSVVGAHIGPGAIAIAYLVK